MILAAWILILTGAALAAQPIAANVGMDFRDLMQFIVAAAVMYQGYALLKHKPHAWKAALLLASGLGVVGVARACLIIYGLWPLAAIPPGIVPTLAWSAGSAAAFAIACGAILRDRSIQRRQ